MRPEVIAAIIGALATIITALLTTFKKTKEREKTAKEKKKIIMDHPFFTRCHYWINHKAPNLTVTNKPLKQAFIRKAMQVKLQIVYDAVKADVLDFSQCDKNKEEAAEFIEALYEKLEKAWRGIGAPRLFVDKYNLWNTPRMKETFLQYERICSCGWYSDLDKRVAKLDMWLYLMNWTIVDASRTLGLLNGELDAALRRNYQKTVN